MARLLLIIAMLLPAAAAAQPAISFDTTTHDFGMVRQGEQTEFRFGIVNAGSEELTIQLTAS